MILQEIIKKYAPDPGKVIPVDSVDGLEEYEKYQSICFLLAEIEKLQAELAEKEEIIRIEKAAVKQRNIDIHSRDKEIERLKKTLEFIANATCENEYEFCHGELNLLARQALKEQG